MKLTSLVFSAIKFITTEVFNSEHEIFTYVAIPNKDNLMEVF